MESKQEEKQDRKIIKKILIIFIVLVIVAAVVAGVVYIYVKDKLNKIQVTEIDKNDLEITEEAKEEQQKYRNIALFGIDSREDEYGRGNRSDCIIIASINNEDKTVKLVSVYRDTMLNIEGHGLDKVTHAYSFGEAPLALKTLNTNLDLDISEFVTVNFSSLSTAIDKLGGVDIEITQDELKYINGYIDGTSKNTGKQSAHIDTPGKYTLDGIQAVAYSRIRYTEGGDYKRTERMRTVLEAMFNKIKTKNVAQANEVINEILPKVYTNINVDEIISMLPKYMSYSVKNSIGWPYETKGITLDRWYGVPVELSDNVIRLHKELFDNEEYELPENIKNISNSIVKKTGYKN